MDAVISKKRGTFLSLILFINSVALALSLFNQTGNDIPTPSWLFFNPNVVSTLSVFLTFILLWNIWLWKKWAVYAKLGLDMVLTIFSSLLLLSEPDTNVVILAIAFLLASFVLSDGLLFWAAKRKWRHFS